MTQWQAAFKVKSFKAAIIRRKWLGGGGGRRSEVTGGRATSQKMKHAKLVPLFDCNNKFCCHNFPVLSDACI